MSTTVLDARQQLWLQLVSLQTNEARSLNAPTIPLLVSIRNNAPRALAAPHHSSLGSADNAFPGGMLLLKPNRFWTAAAVLVPRIPPQATATVRITTRPTVGFKTIDELDVEARFELCADDGARGAFVPCAGTFSTDGAVWHKSMVEFAGDVINTEPAAPLRSTVRVLFAGAVPHAGTSTLVNTALTTLSFSKHPLWIAPTACSSPPVAAAAASGATCVAVYTPELDREDACAVDGDADACKVRLLDIASGENVSNERLAEIIGGSYEDHSGTAGTADRKCDAVVYVMPASLLQSQPAGDRCSQRALQQAVDKYHALNRACSNALVAITQLDLCPPAGHARLRQAAQQHLGVPLSRVFLAPAYIDEAKRIAAVEQPCLALLLSATRQAIMNQNRR